MLGAGERASVSSFHLLVCIELKADLFDCTPRVMTGQEFTCSETGLGGDTMADGIANLELET